MKNPLWYYRLGSGFFMLVVILDGDATRESSAKRVERSELELTFGLGKAEKELRRTRMPDEKRKRILGIGYDPSTDSLGVVAKPSGQERKYSLEFWPVGSF